MNFARPKLHTRSLITCVCSSGGCTQIRHTALTPNAMGSLRRVAVRQQLLLWRQIGRFGNPIMVLPACNTVQGKLLSRSSATHWVSRFCRKYAIWFCPRLTLARAQSSFCLLMSSHHLPISAWVSSCFPFRSRVRILLHAWPNHPSCEFANFSFIGETFRVVRMLRFLTTSRIVYFLRILFP